jgi:hypothetical protein
MNKYLTILLLVISGSIFAHPHDAPLTFRKHMTDDGRVIWSNIPKSCFSKGLLTCEGLHPIYGNPVVTKKAAPSSAEKTSQQSAPSTSAVTTSWQCGTTKSCNEIDSCAEATYYLNECGLSDLDRDGDGLPCEAICK